jgi:Leucine Rich repeat
LETKKTQRGFWQPFHANRTVVDLRIRFGDANQQGAAFGNSLSGMMEYMPQLQRLHCKDCVLHEEGVRAMQPGLQVNRTLRKLSLWNCGIGDAGSRLVADALVENTIIDIFDVGENAITCIDLDDITRILASTRVQTLNLSHNDSAFGKEAFTQRFARVLSRHGFLTFLNLFNCRLGNKGIHILADGLAGNTIMKTLGIFHNFITSLGLADIARIFELTQLRTIYLCGAAVVIFSDIDATQRFASTLQHKESSLQELPEIHPYLFPVNIRAATFTSIKSSLTRNQKLNRVMNLLFAPPEQQQQQPPPQQRRRAQHGNTMMMREILHQAITKFAKVSDSNINNAGASAIFKLFQARPTILENRLKRPPATAARR